MKRTLADTNASLTAFIVSFEMFKRVPHSAFHSLEYTHMRTILSQLNDNTWFKTFSDLTDTEHETMDRLLSKYSQNGKWFQRELVVLKILQQNRFNAWMRVIEEYIGLEDCKPHHENYRIILAIVREKQCDPDHDPSLTMRDDKLVIDLNDVKLDTLGLDSSAALSGHPPTFNTDSLPSPLAGWVGPRFGPSSSDRNGPLSPTSNVDIGRSEVMTQNAISDEAAREALTTYGAYTLRPALLQQSSLLTNPPTTTTTTWSRCSVTREHEEPKTLLQRIQQFRSRAISIIDLKLQLTELQAAQLTNLIQELNQLEQDNRFEHKMVELSMIDRERGMITKQTLGTKIDVMHVIVQRALKQSVNALPAYYTLIRRGPPPALWRGPPPPPTQKEEPEIIIVEGKPRRKPYKGWKSTGKNRRRSMPSSICSSNTSDSDSSTSTLTTSSSGGCMRKGRNRTRHRTRKSTTSGDLEYTDCSSCEETLIARWKVDPIAIKFNQEEKGKDVVQLLLERWTPVGDGNMKEKGDEKEDREVSESKRRVREVVIEEDSSSLADD